MTTLSKPSEKVALVSRPKMAVNGIVEYEHRCRMLKNEQERCQALRKQYGYLGDDATVDALHWLALAFQAVPSLAKWAATKTWRGRKPSPVEMKRITMDWIHQPCCWKTRELVYARLTQES